MSPPPGPPAPRAARALALGALLSACAPAAAPAPAAVSPTLAEVLAPDPVWPEVAAALESLRSRPEADVLLSLGEENTRCSLVAEMDVKLLRCGEALLRAPTLAEMLKSINAGAMHRAYVLEGLSRPGAAREALGSPQPTFEPQPPNGVRWRQEAGGLAIEFRVEQRGQIVASYQGLDGPESFTAASPREAWREAAARLTAIETERREQLFTTTAERIIALLAEPVSLETSTVDGIKLGESYRAQAPFKRKRSRYPSFPISELFTGDSSRWSFETSFLAPERHRLSLRAETLQDRVIEAERAAQFVSGTFPEQAAPIAPICARMQGWIERRFTLAGGVKPELQQKIIEAGQSPWGAASCEWKFERNGTRITLLFSFLVATLKAERVDAGKEELMARAKQIHDERLRKASCHLCPRVKVGTRFRPGLRVVGVDSKACLMLLEDDRSTDPLSGKHKSTPCDPGLGDTSVAE